MKVLIFGATGMVFVYVSGAATDSTEKGPSMWVRMKGWTENALLRWPFKPVLPVVRALLPQVILSTETMGLAMLYVVRSGYPQPVPEIRDIAAAAARKAQPV